MSSTPDPVSHPPQTPPLTTAADCVNSKKQSSSQSLFQIYYLGCVPTDRRCTDAVLPWLIEELKLRAHEMKLIWLTPGPENMTYVADSGQDLFSHPYSNIVRFHVSTDRISFAYVCQGERERGYFCHVFQALTYEEATLIKQFTDNIREEKIDSGNSSTLQSSATNSTSLAEMAKLQEYHLQYLGHTESEPPTTHAQMQFIDSTLDKLKVSHSMQTRQTHKTDTDPMALASPSPTLGRHTKSDISMVLREPDKQQPVPLRLPSNRRPRRKGERAGSGTGVAIRVIRATPEPDLVLSESPKGLPKAESSPLLTRSSVLKSQLPPVGGEGEDRERGDTNTGLSCEVEQAARAEPQQKIGAEEATSAKFSLGPQVLVTGNQSEAGAESKDAHEPSQESGISHSRQSSQESGISHSRQSSQYETAEVTVEIADEQEDLVMGEEGDPGVVPPTSRKRSLTVLSHGGTIINEKQSDDWEDPSNETSTDGPDPHVLSPEGVQDLESPRSAESLSGQSSTSTSTSTSTHSLERAKSLERIKTNKSFMATACEEEDQEQTDYDVLPDLDNLRGTPEFQALGSVSDLPQQSVRLVFSGFCVSVLLEESGELLLKRSIRTIACCAQGKKESSCIGFISREGAARNYFCHVFKAENERMAEKVMESFKSSFAYAFSASLPTTLCDTCPLQRLDQLCRTLKGEPVQVAQSRVQECLQSLSEADYTVIMRQYKTHEHSEHEFIQLVVLVSLLHRHFLRKQEHHTHHIASQSSRGGFRRRGQSDAVRPTKRSALERAKQALASSFDNLRTRKSTKPLQTANSTETQPVNALSQSLNVSSGASLSKQAENDRLASSARLSAAAVRAERREGEGRDPENRGRSSSFRLLRRKNKNASGSETEARSLSDDESFKDVISPKQGSKMLVATREEEARQGSATSSRSASPLPSSPPRTPPLLHKTNLGISHSFPPSGFKTPPLSPPLSPIIKKHSTRPGRVKVPGTVSFQRQAFTPPSATSVSHVPFRKGHRRSVSMIYESVTPKKDGEDRKPSLDDWELIGLPPVGGSGAAEGGEGSPRLTARHRWRQAIEQQIMLNQMEQQNKSVVLQKQEADLKRLKLFYRDDSLSSEESEGTWSKLLSQTNPRRKDVHKALIQGVHPGRRAEVWQFLINQYRARQGEGQGEETGFCVSSRVSCQKLCEEETEYEAAISADIGRTFPSHPYFSSRLKKGQQALYNILYAYAVLDPETGYCQGLSFVAGMFLMHTKDEESAFQMLCDFMILYNYRTLYSSDLSMLQVRLYQFSRLLQDVIPSLSYHLNQHDITPFFYAGPWFLTLFASQYPIAFVARVLDLFFYEGPDTVFKVSLALLNSHQDTLLQCSSMEATSTYLKTNLPQRVLDNLPKIIAESLQLDLGSKLQRFETEYEVYDELSTAFQINLAADTESTNLILKRQNKVMIEQLAICHGSIRSLESVIMGLRNELEEQRQRIEKLESERRSLPEGDS